MNRTEIHRQVRWIKRQGVTRKLQKSRWRKTICTMLAWCASAACWRRCIWCMPFTGNTIRPALQLQGQQAGIAGISSVSGWSRCYRWVMLRICEFGENMMLFIRIRWHYSDAVNAALSQLTFDSFQQATSWLRSLALSSEASARFFSWQEPKVAMLSYN